MQGKQYIIQNEIKKINIEKEDMFLIVYKLSIMTSVGKKTQRSGRKWRSHKIYEAEK
jgi:hypothetical protein